MLTKLDCFQVLLTKLDCNVHTKFCGEQHSIDHYPTVRAYANSGTEFVTYTGQMDAEVPPTRSSNSPAGGTKCRAVGGKGGAGLAWS